MIGTFDVVDMLWQLIKSGPLYNSVHGSVWKYGRPVNSAKEDIVINSLPINSAQLQTGVANVNIHVPNQMVLIEGFGQSKQPNHLRLKQLYDLAKVELHNKRVGDTFFEIQQQTTFDEGESSFVNIRINFFSINSTT